MVLLTAGQVSVAISSAIVFFFTFILFLAGYTLQQQTLHNLQSAIAPSVPSPRSRIAEVRSPESINPGAKAARPVGKRKNEHSKLQAYSSYAPAVDWSKLAYVQVVRDHNEVCGAVMLFEELYLHKSPARRVLVFPSSWVEDPNPSQEKVKNPEDSYALTRRRLLQKAARRFRVELVPVRTIDDEAQAMAAMFGLDGYDRALYLQTPGTILNAAPLDSLLAFAPGAPLTALATSDSIVNEQVSSVSPSLLLIQPSKSSLHRLLNALAVSSLSSSANVSTLLTTAFPPPASILSPSFLDTAEQATLLATTHSLTEATGSDNGDFFNASSYLAETGFVRFEDPRLPGPEVSLPWNVKVLVRPKVDAAKRVWDAVYERWRVRRMEVCGLDLEAWREEFAAALEGTKRRSAEEAAELEMQGKVRELK